MKLSLRHIFLPRFCYDWDENKQRALFCRGGSFSAAAGRRKSLPAEKPPAAGGGQQKNAGPAAHSSVPVSYTHLGAGSGKRRSPLPSILSPPLRCSDVYIFLWAVRIYTEEVNPLTRKKAFWLSFACTLGVLIPIYAAALFFGTAHLGSPDAAAAGEGVGIAVRRPDAGDSKNLLLVVRDGEDASFSLVRFDALQGKVCVCLLYTSCTVTWMPHSSSCAATSVAAYRLNELPE